MDPADDFDRAALALLALDFDAEGLYRTWDEIYARMRRIEESRKSETHESREGSLP